jgi:hypothetical protein
MTLSSTTFCSLGVVLIITTVLGLGVAFSSHPQSGFETLALPLPPTGSSIPLSAEQLREVQTKPNAGFFFRQECLELFVDISFLTGITLLTVGMVKCIRKGK